MSPIKDLIVVPFCDAIAFRSPDEKLNEEVYRSIPALNQLTQSSLIVSNKLSQDARNALFFDAGLSEPALRVLKVEVSMAKRDQMENVQPDIEYMKGQSPAGRKSFESAAEDDWLTPAP